MAEKKRDIGKETLDGLREIKQGRVTNVPSVASIRVGTDLSQSRFAELIGVSVRTLQEGEQGRHTPSGTARTLHLNAWKNSQTLIDMA